jgi:hypothetical protein
MDQEKNIDSKESNRESIPLPKGVEANQKWVLDQKKTYTEKYQTTKSSVLNLLGARDLYLSNYKSW